MTYRYTHIKESLHLQKRSLYLKYMMNMKTHILQSRREQETGDVQS